mmetsp:Transcript_13148/g.39784  ORF Transcript_13148/g.39784 Transcript_13148/m.39784 type:complete len:260 (+) Transcript_13148:1475-2254(+)
MMDMSSMRPWLKDSSFAVCTALPSRSWNATLWPVMLEETLALTAAWLEAAVIRCSMSLSTRMNESSSPPRAMPTPLPTTCTKEGADQNTWPEESCSLATAKPVPLADDRTTLPCLHALAKISPLQLTRSWWVRRSTGWVRRRWGCRRCFLWRSLPPAASSLPLPLSLSDSPPGNETGTAERLSTSSALSTSSLSIESRSFFLMLFDLLGILLSLWRWWWCSVVKSRCISFWAEMTSCARSTVVHLSVSEHKYNTQWKLA